MYFCLFIYFCFFFFFFFFNDTATTEIYTLSLHDALPIGVATGVLARRYVPADEGTGLSGDVDVSGAVLVTAALMLGVYTIVKPAAESGWTSGATLGAAAA